MNDFEKKHDVHLKFNSAETKMRYILGDNYTEQPDIFIPDEANATTPKLLQDIYKVKRLTIPPIPSDDKIKGITDHIKEYTSVRYLQDVDKFHTYKEQKTITENVYRCISVSYTHLRAHET